MAEQGKDKKQVKHQLKRSIGLFQVIMYGIGLILGIYVIIGDVAGIAGNAMWISFIVAAFIALMTGLSYAELSSIFPKSGSRIDIYAKNAFGNDFVASIIGCLIIFVAIVSAATLAIGFSQYLHLFFPQVSTVITAIVLIAILSIVNFYGISESIWINTIFTSIELAGLVIIIVAGLWFGSVGNVNYYEIPFKNNMSSHVER